MTKDSKVRLKEMKGSKYKCPVCKKGSLVEIKTDKDFGGVDIKFQTADGIDFEFTCKIKNDYFFLCKNEKCRARFERTRWHEGKGKPGPPCMLKNCVGSLDTYRDIPFAKIYSREDKDNVIIAHRDKVPIEFKIVSGELSYDEAGICSQCHFVGPKEIDMR
jgi:hypothetical protein